MGTIEKENIRKLLDRYFEATSSLDEERQLREYFAAGPEAEFEVYIPLFDCFNKEIGSLDNVCLPEKRKPVNYMIRWISAGAAAAIIICTFIFSPQRKDSLRLFINGERVNDTELAISMANDQFLLLNSMLDKYKGGSKKLEDLNRAGEAISPLSNLDKLLKQNRSEGRLKQ